jgi:hypothetical protein
MKNINKRHDGSIAIAQMLGCTAARILPVYNTSAIYIIKAFDDVIGIDTRIQKLSQRQQPAQSSLVTYCAEAGAS